MWRPMNEDQVVVELPEWRTWPNRMKEAESLGTLQKERNVDILGDIVLKDSRCSAVEQELTSVRLIPSPILIALLPCTACGRGNGAKPGQSTDPRIEMWFFR